MKKSLMYSALVLTKSYCQTFHENQFHMRSSFFLGMVLCYWVIGAGPMFWDSMMVSSSRAKCPMKKTPNWEYHNPEERRPQADHCESLTTLSVMCIQNSFFLQELII